MKNKKKKVSKNEDYLIKHIKILETHIEELHSDYMCVYREMVRRGDELRKK